MDRRALQMGENQIRHVCAAWLGKGRREAGMGAVLAFLEVDDAWHESLPLIWSLTASSLTRYDSLDYLSAALSARQTVRITAELKNIPVRANDEAPSHPTYTLLQRLTALRRFATDRTALARRAELRRVIEQLTQYPDETVHSAANAALNRMTLEPLRIETAKALSLQ